MIPKDESNPSIMQFRFYLKIFLLLFLGTIFVYANSLRNPFIWDDQYLISNNHFIKSFNYIGEIFSHHLYYSTAGLSNFYRPLQTLLLTLDYSLWKYNPFGYHLTSLIVHVINGFLIALIIELLFKRRLVAFMVALLFLIHPINSTAVDYISSRADSQATLFVLLSFWLFFKYILRKGSSKFCYIGSIISFILALLSKELSVILPFLIIVSISIYKNEGPVKNSAYKKTAPFFIILGIYAFLRLTILNFESPVLGTFPNLYIRLLTTIRSFVNLMGLIFLPLKIHIEKSIPYSQSFFEPATFISVMILSMIGVALFRIRRYSRMCLFGFVWFFVSLLPMANIVPINTTIADHWLYLPIFGFFLSIIGGTDEWIKRSNLSSNKLVRNALLGLYVSAVIVLSILTIKQNTIWKDPLVFHQTALTYSPESFRAHNEIGVIYLDQNKYEEAISEFKKAIEMNPNFDQAYDNLGVAYDKKGDLNESILAHKKALNINSQNPKTYNNLGNAYNKLNQFDEAIKSYEKALALNPSYKEVYNNLGVVYYKMGKFEEARGKWEKVFEIDPYSEGTRKNLEILNEVLNQSKN